MDDIEQIIIDDVILISKQFKLTVKISHDYDNYLIIHIGKNIWYSSEISLLEIKCHKYIPSCEIIHIIGVMSHSLSYHSYFKINYIDYQYNVLYRIIKDTYAFKWNRIHTWF
jgi:hypothetical protein